MYESQFNLTGRPFASVPDPEHYYPASAIENARRALVTHVDRASGPVVVFGPVGTGKTLLCHLAANRFREELSVCLLSSTRLCNRRTLLQAILYELGLPFRHLEEGELRIALVDHLASQEACPNGMLLIVDEADTLPLMLLEEIRVITNLVRGGQPRVRLVLSGGQRLEERLAHPRMESLNQRIVCRLYLGNYSREETSGYIQARVNASGGDASRLFTSTAMQAIHRATTGVPRLVNQLCDHALVLAAVGGHRQLDVHGIEEAWSDLQQLPAPPTSAPIREHASVEHSTIEFGPLEDDVVEDYEFSNMETTRTDPESRLDNIQRQVEAAREDALMPEGTVTERAFEQLFEPGTTCVDHPDTDVVAEVTSFAGGEPEIEIAFSTSPNPFDEAFEEEELVLDRHASPSILARRREYSVSCKASDRISTRLKASCRGLRVTVPHEETAEVADSNGHLEFSLHARQTGTKQESQPDPLDSLPDNSDVTTLGVSGLDGDYNDTWRGRA